MAHTEALPDLRGLGPCLGASVAGVALAVAVAVPLAGVPGIAAVVIQVQDAVAVRVLVACAEVPAEQAIRARAVAEVLRPRAHGRAGRIASAVVPREVAAPDAIELAAIEHEGAGAHAGAAGSGCHKRGRIRQAIVHL